MFSQFERSKNRETFLRQEAGDGSALDLRFGERMIPMYFYPVDLETTYIIFF